MPDPARLSIDGYNVDVNTKPFIESNLDLPNRRELTHHVISNHFNVISSSMIEIMKEGSNIQLERAYIVEDGYNEYAERIYYTFGILSENDLQNISRYAYEKGGHIYFDYLEMKEKLNTSLPTIIYNGLTLALLEEGDYCKVTLKFLDAADELMATKIEPL